MITATATTCYDPSSIMKPLLSIRGELHAPYFIFLRCADKYSDLEILRQFMLLKYRPTALPAIDRYAIIANDTQWTMIADDWFYTMYHMPSTRLAVELLAKDFDVFTCAVGDSDHSFEF